jgi:hypothetical protein
VDLIRTSTSTVASAGALLVAAWFALPSIGNGSPARSGKGCTADRGGVGNLSDPRAKRVSLVPHATSVDALRALGRPRADVKGRRTRGVETRTYSVKAALVGMRLAGGTIELLVAQPGRLDHTIVAAFPDPGCARPKRASTGRAMRRARSAALAACGKPAGASLVALEGSATITGVGFFDPGNSTSGAAPNRIELRPVLKLRSSSCRPASKPVVGTASPPPAASPVVERAVPPAPPPARSGPKDLAPPNPPCDKSLNGGAIEDEVNGEPNRVICLRTGYYSEPGDALIVIRQPGVRVQAAPGAEPWVCGRFVARAAGVSIGPEIRIDPNCQPYFNEDSPYNKLASSYPASVPIPSTWLTDFDGNGTEPLDLSRSWEHGKAIFRAFPVNSFATFRIADSSQCFDDPVSCASWQPLDPDQRVADESSPDPDQIPIPAGVRCPGLPVVDNDHDRALVVISEDGRTAWEFWHCTHAATPEEPWYTAAIAARWSLDPDDPSIRSRGYQDEGLGGIGTGSARASGMPLVETTIAPHEALWGIHHTLGLAVRQVDDGYVNPPASHTDGCAGCSHLRYGMLFVLDPGFQPPPGTSQGALNVVDALKRFGAYVVDRGAVFELHGSPNEPDDPSRSDQEWEQAGITFTQLGITPGDLRYVPTPGAPPALP